MVAITNGLFIDVWPSVSNFTRSLDWSRRWKYSTIWFQDASFRSSPGTNPNTASGAGMAGAVAAGFWVPCEVVSETDDSSETRSNRDARLRRIGFASSNGEVELEDRKQFSESILIRETPKVAFPTDR